MSTLLITGASGYLARALIPLAAQGARVVGCARDACRVVGPAEALALDVTDAGAVEAAVELAQADAIVHAAASNPGDGSTEQMESVNAHAAAHVAKAAWRVDAVWCWCRRTTSLTACTHPMLTMLPLNHLLLTLME